MKTIEDLSQRVLTEDHLPYEPWEIQQVDILENSGACTSYEMEVLRAEPAVWRALRAMLKQEGVGS